ncbi:MAG: CD225/dispanin family protein [Oscillospiraceae bacterium]|nr:CD225/dispanin family protein [Oscillospiraceae bacterium]
MLCRKCGTEINDGVYFCPNCGEKTEVPQNTFSGEYYKNEPASYKEPLNTTLWIILGVISAFFCCLPGGIITTVYAAKASGNTNSGDIETAKENLKTAKGWFIATIIISAIITFFGVLGSIVYSFTY